MTDSTHYNTEIGKGLQKLENDFDRRTDMETRLVVFKDKEIRRILIDNEWHFAVVDVVAALTDSDKPRDYWYRMKKGR